MKKAIKQAVIYSAVILSVPLMLAGCHRNPNTNAESAKPALIGCSSNPYLAKYNCSIQRIQTAAENGNPDAQYALGYMYYYGIDTMQDQKTAALWIHRAAKQGQPLAKKAWELIDSNAQFNDLHTAAAQSVTQASQQGSTIQYQPNEDVNSLNGKSHQEPITTHLPAYHAEEHNKAESPVISVSHVSQENAESTYYAQYTPPKKSASVSSNESPDTATSVSMNTPSDKMDAVHDPRLAANAPPVVASSASNHPVQS